VGGGWGEGVWEEEDRKGGGNITCVTLATPQTEQQQATISAKLV